jgi:hypothetical protein
MSKLYEKLSVSVLVLGLLPSAPVMAEPFLFTTEPATNFIASATRPASAGKFEIETGDDFALTSETVITGATFAGLLTGAAPTIGEVVVEVYRVFPKDSDVGRTSGSPTFSTANVPTRINSPSDVAFDSRDSAEVGELTFTTNTLAASFTANNSVQPGGIHPKPNQTTTGNGAVTGTEAEFSVDLTKPLDLPADHYFFVPQVGVSGGEFLWLSGQRPVPSHRALMICRVGLAMKAMEGYSQIGCASAPISLTAILFRLSTPPSPSRVPWFPNRPVLPCLG